jgi:hypothetical protein
VRYVRWDDLDPDTVLVDQDGEVVDIMAEAERQGVARDGSPWEGWVEAGAVDEDVWGHEPDRGEPLRLDDWQRWWVGQLVTDPTLDPWTVRIGDSKFRLRPDYDNGRVIEGEVVDPRTRCAHVAGRVRTFVPGHGPRETCERCGTWVAGVPELGR